MRRQQVNERQKTGTRSAGRRPAPVNPPCAAFTTAGSGCAAKAGATTGAGCTAGAGAGCTVGAGAGAAAGAAAAFVAGEPPNTKPPPPTPAARVDAGGGDAAGLAAGTWAPVPPARPPLRDAGPGEVTGEEPKPQCSRPLGDCAALRRDRPRLTGGGEGLSGSGEAGEVAAYSADANPVPRVGFGAMRREAEVRRWWWQETALADGEEVFVACGT